MSKQTKLFDNNTNTQIPPKAFIESYKFPWIEISEASAVEKGPGRPPHWEMVFWWTRKPLISARAIIAGCLLPEETSARAFLRGIGIGGKSKAAHNNPPLYRFSGIKLLDPFAGFGSIPLEAMRLGLEATAVELLPTAYIFLKAVLEYPAKYGKKLVEDVERWGKWITEQLREDPLIKKLYDEDTAVYIGSWEIKCPHCGRWTPLIGNWWLARVKGNKGYERLAWMKPVIKEDKVEIDVVDLNKTLDDRAVKDAQVSGLRVTVNGKEYRVPEANIEARHEKAVCLLCHQPIMQVDPQTGRHYTETKNLSKEVKKRLESYVKYAIKTYNQSLEQEGVTPLARQRLLIKVKVKGGDLEFEPCTQKDQEKLELARKEVEKMLQEGDPDIPREPVPTYEVRRITPILSADKWYKLFNPRQLLTLVKLVKLIREAGKKIEEEKQREGGQTKEEADTYTEAITAYLALSLCKNADFNSIVSHWTITWLIPNEALAMRGIAMVWNYGEYSPFVNSTGTWSKNVSKIVDFLTYFIWSSSSSSKEVRVIIDDASVLSKLQVGETYNLIITDPPYYDDVPYAELSDFYYVWLKRALSDTRDGRLVPRFLPEAFFERVGDSWVEISTQWEKYALSEVSLNPPRLGVGASYEDGVRHFQNLLNASFITMASRLVDDGLLVTYYAHTDPDAWKALLKAGWEAAGLRVTNAFPITTESAQSVVKRGKLSMDSSIVVTWRKGASGFIEAFRLYDEMVEAAVERAMRLIELGIVGRDLFINTLASALAVATRYREVVSLGKLSVDELVDKYVYPATSMGIARAFARRAEIKDGVKSPDAMFYLLVKCLMAGARSKVIESTDLRLLSIGTSLNVKAALREWKLLREVGGEEEEAGAKVAKAKNLILLEPPSVEKAKIAELLEIRGVGVSDEPNIRCVVDVLHVLEYNAVTYPAVEYKRRLEKLREKYPAQVNEALSLARIFARILPEGDPEKILCERVISPVLQFGGV